MNQRYVTTNVRLPADVYMRLKRRSAEVGTSLGELVREAVGEYLVTREPDVSPETWLADPFFSVIGVGASGRSDGSEKHDSQLYGSGDPAPRRPGSKGVDDEKTVR